MVSSNTIHDAVLIVNSMDPNAPLLDIHSGLTLHTFKPCLSIPQGVAPLSKSSPSFVAIHQDASLLHLFNYQHPILKSPCPEKLSTVMVSTSTSFILAGAESGRVYLWDRPSGTLLNTWQPHFQAVTVLIDSSDGALFVTAGKDAVVRVYDFAQLIHPHPTPRYTFHAHTLPITKAAFTLTLSTITRLLTSSLDHTVQVHCMATGHLLSTLSFPIPIRTFALHPLNTCVYVGGGGGGGSSKETKEGRDGSLYQRALTASTPWTRIPLPTTPTQASVTQVLITPSTLLVGTDQGHVYWYDVATLVVTRTVTCVHPIVQLIYFPLLPSQKEQWTPIPSAPLMKYLPSPPPTSSSSSSTSSKSSSSSSSCSSFLLMPSSSSSTSGLQPDPWTFPLHPHPTMNPPTSSPSSSLNLLYHAAMHESLDSVYLETFRSAYQHVKQTNETLWKVWVETHEREGKGAIGGGG
ncbi:Pre-rRNA-processing protein ipi3 [Coelomomyces lativittatus]|nr:Pre-rRNA-processing protein ipi3 [Coelomomyces lativittatus]